MSIIYHKAPLTKVFKELGTSKSGLKSYQVEKLHKLYGLNKLSEKKDKPLILQFLLEFKNFFSILLLIGAALSFISEWLQPNQGSIYIAWALVGVTLLNAIFTFAQEYSAKQAMNSFKDLITTKITVVRHGKELEIDATDLVPGDIMILREGDKIPADARILECYNLKVDHASLTGETEPQLRSVKPTHKDPLLSRNMVFSGTLVQNGSGRAVVVATGDNTKIGKIAKLTNTVDITTSHMQEQLSGFIKIISIIAIILGVVFFGLGFLTGNSFWVNMVFAIGIIVANVPEGLLPTVTLTLSIAAKKMAKHNALVKNMDAIETLGSLTVICSDKTGTLTTNQLSVRSFYLNNTLYTFNEKSQEILANGKKYHIHQIKGGQHFRDVLVNCNNSTYDQASKEGSGDPTEICLKSFVSNFSNLDYVEKHMPRVFEVPFESGKKYMITANKVGNEVKAYLKGAPEQVLAKCSSLSVNRKKSKLSKAKIEELLKVNREYASQGYRVLALAVKDTKGSKPNEKDLEKNNYVFYGLVIMQDPPREEVPAAVKECKEAGIKVVVISGDQGTTVASIAQQVGICSKNPTITTSDDLAKMSDAQLKELLKNDELIFARAMPEDKMRIVQAFQEMDEIVAVTGDGVNDAPALKRANVGVAMGKSGTAVAQDAADVILLDDNFATIAKAIKFGRTVYDNIQSFIMYILTSNIPEIMPFLLFVLFSFINFPLALPVLLILAIDLGTDMIPAIGLGVESPSKDIMKRKPRDPKAPLCNWKMIVRSYGFFGPVQTLFSFLVFFHILYSGGWSFAQGIPAVNDVLYMQAVTGFFVTIIVTQMFNVFACRSAHTSIFVKGIFSNKIIWLGIGTEIVLILALIYTPLSTVFSTAAFPASYIPWMIGAGMFMLVIEEGRKFLERKYGYFHIR